ncbi:MAG TPA: MarR family transcriptional regulator [Acidimicrobiales bacterium]|nr:MarR family transcriptional regulator [Acidimicrobiales bacterium]
MGAEVVAPECHGGEDGAPAPALIDGERHQLYDRLVGALRDYGAQSGRMVEVFASAQQMHRTDLHALLVIMNTQRDGRCATPKVLTEALNLTSGAVTGVVDRLVRSGHVERETDNFDRRQVKLVHRAPAMAVARDFLEPLGSRMEQLMASYSTDELATVERFLSGATQVLTEHVRALGGLPKDV